jgi:hypothetical protein
MSMERDYISPSSSTDPLEPEVDVVIEADVTESGTSGQGFVQEAGNAVQQAGSAVGQGASSVGSGIAGLAGRLRQGAQQGAKQVKGGARSNPLGFALGAVSVGFLAGLLSRSSQAEQQALAPAADEVTRRSQRVRQGVGEMGRSVAQQAREYERQTLGG